MQSITVEPLMILYMLAFMMTSIVEEEFYLQKSCRAHLKMSPEVCGNLSSLPELKKEVQVITARFHQWRTLSGQLIPIVLTLFMGAWSDKWGRKLFLLVGLAGKIIFSLMMSLNAVFMEWPLEYIIYTAVIPNSLTGADVAILTSCNSYISDVTSKEDRSARITLLDGCYLLTIPIGISLGSFLFHRVVNKSFVVMWALNSALLLAAFVFGCLVLNFVSSPKNQKSVKEVSLCEFFKDIFRIGYICKTFKIFRKPAPGSLTNRRNIVLLIVAMGLYIFQRDEKPYLYMYTQLKFNWGVSEFSFYKTMASVNFAVCMLVGARILTKCFKLKDYTIIMIGTLSHISARIWYFLADQPTYMYVGAAFCGLGPLVAPMIRASVSKQTDEKCLGKAFSLLSIADNCLVMLSGLCYSQIYRNTINVGPFFLLLTIGTQMGVACIALFLSLTRKTATPQATNEIETC